MTTISASSGRSRATAFERTLLRTSAALDSYVASRLERRSAAARRRVLAAQDARDIARGAAEARGAIGILPR